MAYCGQCGNRVYEGDQFCGSCGAVLLPDFQDSDSTEEIPSQPRTPQSLQSPRHTSYDAARNGTRPLILVAAIALVLLFLLAGAGAATFAGIGPLAALMGQDTQTPAVDEQGDSPEAATPPVTVQEDTLQGDTEPEPEETGTPFNPSPDGGSALAMEEKAQQAVEDYYEAVNDDDWAYTYAHRDSYTQSVFTEEEWALKNQWFESTNSTISVPVSVDLDESTLASYQPVANVERELTIDSTGYSEIREATFVYENGTWAVQYPEGGMPLYMPDASFEEFVEANGGSTP